MHITIRGLNSPYQKSRDVWLPVEEEILQEICNDLEIKITTQANWYIENISDKKSKRTNGNGNAYIVWWLNA